MSDKFEYQGQTYQNLNGEWYDAGFIRVPLVLARQLDAVAGVKRQAAQAKVVKRRQAAPAGEDESAFSHAEVFPFIAEIIHELASPGGEFVRHGKLVEALLAHGEARGKIEEAVARKGHTALDWSHWMVQWFSAAITTNSSPYTHAFERRREADGWAYRPAEGGGGQRSSV